LQKRVLNDVKFETKNVDLEYTITDAFWDIGINFIEKCDLCKSDVNSVFVDDEFNDKHRCENCNKMVCSDCFNYNKKLCQKCVELKIIVEL